MTNSEEWRRRRRRRRRIIIEDSDDDIDVSTTGDGFDDSSRCGRGCDGEEVGKEDESSFDDVNNMAGDDDDELDDEKDSDYEDEEEELSSSSYSSSVDGAPATLCAVGGRDEEMGKTPRPSVLEYRGGGGDDSGDERDEGGRAGDDGGDSDETVTLSDDSDGGFSLAHASVVSSSIGSSGGVDDGVGVHGVTVEAVVVDETGPGWRSKEGIDSAAGSLVGAFADLDICLSPAAASPSSSSPPLNNDSPPTLEDRTDGGGDAGDDGDGEGSLAHASVVASPDVEGADLRGGDDASATVEAIVVVASVDEGGSDHDDADGGEEGVGDGGGGDEEESSPRNSNHPGGDFTDTSGRISLVEAFADLEIRHQSPSPCRSDDAAQPNTSEVCSDSPSSRSNGSDGEYSSGSSSAVVVEGRRLFEDDDDDDDHGETSLSAPPSPPASSAPGDDARTRTGGEDTASFTLVEGERAEPPASAPSPPASTRPGDGAGIEGKEGWSPTASKAGTFGPSQRVESTGTKVSFDVEDGTPSNNDVGANDGWTFDANSCEYALAQVGQGGTGTPEDGGGRRFFRIPEQLYGRLYDHQREGVRWLVGLFDSGVGGILGDDMGMGKTFQTLVLLGGLMRARSIRNALVMCPVSLLRTWQREAGDILKSCCPKVSIVVASSDIPKAKRQNLLRQAITCSARRPHLVITTYGLVGTCPDDLIPRDYNGSETSWDYVVLDEGHKIKNPSTKVNKGCHRICRSSTKTTTHRLLLTGTPIQNNLRELWALFDWATAGTLLGKLPRFLDRFAAPIEQGRHKNASKSALQIAERANRELQDLLRPHFLQRFKKSVFAGKLPAKTECVIWTHLSARQRAMYEHFVNSGHVTAVLSGETSSPLVAVTWLKKLCGHPSLLSAGETLENRTTNVTAERNISREQLMNDSSKLQTLVSLIGYLKGAGHRTLIFSQSTKMLDIIQMVLRPLKLSRIDGTTKERDRQGAVDEFNREGSDIVAILLSTKAVGLGLTLTGADRAVIYDPSWNPADDSQAVDRCYRIGTTKPVTVYRLIAAGTVEERMYEKQVHKDGIRRTLLTNAGNATERYFDTSELQRLFELSPPGVCSVLEKIKLPKEGTGKCEDTYSMGRSLFIESLSGVVGISSHDHLYTETVVDVEDRDSNNAILQSPFARTPCQKSKYGRARRVLADCNRGILTSKDNVDVAPDNYKRASSQPLKVVRAKNNECSDNETSAIQVANYLDEENIPAADSRNDADYSSSQVRIDEILRRVDALGGEHQLEEKMGLLLDAVEIGSTDKQQKIYVHMQIASVAKALQWL